MNKLKDKILVQIFIIYTRYLIGGAFVFASIVKIKGERFTGRNGELDAINSLFHFFETMYQSGVYWKFIGLGQLIAGLLLLTQKYAKLGTLIYFPIILNIFIITLSYNFTGTPIITGLMLLASIILIIWDWNDFKVLFNMKQKTDLKVRLENDRIWIIIGGILFSITLITTLTIRANIGLWFIICFSIGLIGLLIGLKRKRNQKM